MSQSTALPLWRQIADELRARIEAGRYSADFPGELEIAAEFEVSRGTARAALRPLRDAGLISAARGRRPRLTQVQPDSQYGAIYSLRDLIAADGMQPSSTVLRQRVTREPAAAARLALPEDAQLLQLERVRFADERPVAHDEIFAPASIAAALIEADFTHAAFYEELRSRCGVVIHAGSEHNRAVAAEPKRAEQLDDGAGAPMLLVERVGCSDGTPVELRRTHFVGDRFSTTRAFGPASDAGPCSPTPL